MNMKFSLVMATIGRTAEVERFLDSLNKQTYRNFELVVVDQNEDDRIGELLQDYQEYFTIKHVRSEKGLSHARNVGLEAVTGNVVAFPDDDCEYAHDTLEQAAACFATVDLDGVSGVMYPPERKDEDNNGYCSELIKLNRYNVWVYAISTTIFLKTELTKAVGKFDVNLGAGSGTEYGSGEETDFLIRGLDLGYDIRHSKAIRIYHPALDFNNSSLPQKSFYYSKGRRYVLEKHRYNWLFIALNIYYPLVKLIFHIYNVPKVRYFWRQFLGRWEKPTR